MGNTFINVAYVDIKSIKDFSLGTYSSNTKLRKLFVDIYDKTPEAFIEADEFAILKLGKINSEDDLCAYFELNTLSPRWKWKFVGIKSLSEFEISEVSKGDDGRILETTNSKIESSSNDEEEIEFSGESEEDIPVIDTIADPIENARVISSFEMIDIEGNDVIPSFKMGKYVVVQKIYKEVMQPIPSVNELPSIYTKGNKDLLPVESVTWEEAILFCNTLSRNEGYQVAYSDSGELIAGANGFRLPTKDEWMYAAKEGKNNSSYNFSGSNDINKVAWYQGHNPRGHKGPHEVGKESVLPNKLGLCDMSGNVWEWCSDIENGKHFCCGGAFDSDATKLDLNRADCIRICDRNQKDENIGFRLVRSN